ncbi:MAG: hypothetical protein VKN17_01650 [Cyanobacteriota bacterium]|nr:hypothetical protein [Cyanobacteriota bacterium]
MARFLLVLRPRENQTPAALLNGIDPLLEALHAEVDHRTPAHVSALLKGAAESQRMQLFADVQAKAEGPVLELVLLSREAMGTGAPQTRQAFEHVVNLSGSYMPSCEAIFRSDRDGALPT